MLGEAILIVPQSIITKGATDAEVEIALEEIESAAAREAENRGDEELASLENNGIQLVDEGGVRLAHDSDEEEEEDAKEEKKQRRKRTKKSSTHAKPNSSPYSLAPPNVAVLYGMSSSETTPSVSPILAVCKIMV
jgi:hypothetical protein